MKRWLAATAALLLASNSALAQGLDLGALGAFIRPGFSMEWVFAVPQPSDRAWVYAPGGREPGALGTRGLAALAGVSDRYCILLLFEADDALLAWTSGVGLYLDRIGINWQVYLNGYLVHDETDLARAGRRSRERSIRGALVQLDTRWLRPGPNILALMVAVDPADPRGGLWSRGIYRIDDYSRLASLRSETLRLMIIGIYAFFGLYHAMLFVLQPKTRSYLFYSMAALTLAAYLFARSFTAHELAPDTRILAALETAALLLLLPAFMGFFDAVMGRRPSRLALAYTAASALAAVIQVFAFRDAIRLAWTVSMPLPIAYALYRDALGPILHSFKHYRRLSPGESRLRSLGKALARGDAAKLLAGSTVMGTAALLDALGLSPAVGLSAAELGFLLLVFGTAAVLASQFIRVYRGAERLKSDLERRVATRTAELEAGLQEQEELSRGLSTASERLRAASAAADKDLRIATQVQQGFFPRSPALTPAWDSAFAFIPAGGISGDFYDFYLRGDRLDGLLLGDVSGHGVASGLVTVLARSVFHRNFYERRQRSLGAVIEAINDELVKELSSVENYLTAALLRLEDDGRVEYVSAAHPELLYRPAGAAKALPLKPKAGVEYKGPPLGRAGIEAPYNSVRFSLKPGDALLLFTDGVAESRNTEGEEFGVRGLAASLSAAPAEADAQGLLDYVMQDWRFHVSGAKVADDVSLIVLRKK